MRSCDKLTIGPQTSLREVMAVIDQGAVEIALVVDGEGRLVATVTDGDVRRAILRGLALEAPVAEVSNRQFTAVGPDAASKEVLTLMLARSIKQVPVLSSDGQVLGLHVLPDLIGGVSERSQWAVVMAGGEGQRMRPLTENVPKPMLRVGNQLILGRIITQLVAYGFRRIFLSINYLGFKIEEHFGDGRRFGCTIEYLRESRPLGTAGALSLLPEYPTDSLLVTNGDLVTELNFSALMDYHVQQKHTATLCVREFNYQVPFGVVKVNKYRVASMEEKPLQRFLINAGIYVLEPELLSLIPRDTQYHMPNLLETASAAGKIVGAFPIREYWLDIGRLEDYKLANQQLTMQEEGTL